MTQIKQRCVHIFPKFENNHEIQSIREKYDHLHKCIEPHITLVFPFESDLNVQDMTNAVKRVLDNISSFEITAKGLKAVESHGFYLFLEIDKGSSAISNLHYKLHEYELSPYQSPWTKDGSYKPHITVGRFLNEEDMLAAYNDLRAFNTEFKTLVTKVFVEIIGENDESIIESVVEFGK